MLFKTPPLGRKGFDIPFFPAPLFLFKFIFFLSYLVRMGIISPNNKQERHAPAGTKKAMNEAMSYAANQFITSPVDGVNKTQWQAVVDRLYKTAIYAESDKDATSAAKVIAERLFGRAPVQKQDKKNEIPAIIFAERGDELEQITEKAARAEEDPDDYDGPLNVGIVFEDGSEMIAEAEDSDE